MTLHVTRDGQTVTIHGNIGLHAHVEGSRVVDFAISEERMHLRSFWGQLGRVLDEVERDAADAIVAAAEPEGGSAAPPA